MSNTLIIGAGPTGLAAALFLAERGVSPRIVEQAAEPSPYSKAFGVNPRTLTLLEGTGVTERLLSQGRRMTPVLSPIFPAIAGSARTFILGLDHDVALSRDNP